MDAIEPDNRNLERLLPRDDPSRPDRNRGLPAASLRNSISPNRRATVCKPRRCRPPRHARGLTETASVCPTEDTSRIVGLCIGHDHRRALDRDAWTRRSRLLGRLREIPFQTHDGRPQPVRGVPFATQVLSSLVTNGCALDAPYPPQCSKSPLPVLRSQQRQLSLAWRGGRYCSFWPLG